MTTSFKPGDGSTTAVRFALAKGGFRFGGDILSAKFVKLTDTDEVHQITYYGDDGEPETGYVFINRQTGKGDF